MFEILPTELQHKIYNLLHVEERITMSRVNKKIKSMQNKKHEKQLYALSKLQKVIKVTQNKKISPYVETFIKQNKNDPTVNDFCKDHNINIEEPNLNDLIICIRNNNFNDLDNFKHILYDDNEYYTIGINIYQYANQKTFEQFINLYSDFGKLILQRMNPYFHTLNLNNKELFQYIIDSKEKECIEAYEPFLCYSFEIIAFDRKVQEIIKSTKGFALPPENQISLMEKSLQNLDIDSYIFYKTLNKS